MNKELFIKALTKFFAGLIIVGILLFASAGTFHSIPLVLGSVISFVIMLLYIPIIVKRIRNEEEVLSEGLAGYEEYRRKVKYRLIPFIW